MNPDADRIAREFHETYEYLAPDFSYKTREASSVPWQDVPENNKNLMTAVVDNLMQRGIISPGGSEEP